MTERCPDIIYAIPCIRLQKWMDKIATTASTLIIDHAMMQEIITNFPSPTLRVGSGIFGNCSLTGFMAGLTGELIA